MMLWVVLVYPLNIGKMYIRFLYPRCYHELLGVGVWRTTKNKFINLLLSILYNLNCKVYSHVLYSNIPQKIDRMPEGVCCCCWIKQNFNNVLPSDQSFSRWAMRFGHKFLLFFVFLIFYSNLRPSLPRRSLCKMKFKKVSLFFRISMENYDVMNDVKMCLYIIKTFPLPFILSNLSLRF